MTPQELSDLYRKVQDIRKIDITLDKLIEKTDDKMFAELGERVISVLGRTHLDKCNDWAGRITWVAIFNTLRDQREDLRAEVINQVEVKECRHAVQFVLKDD